MKYPMSYYATIVAMEAAHLGLSPICCNCCFGRVSASKEIEQDYGLSFEFLPRDSEPMSELRDLCRRRRAPMLAEEIDIGPWMLHSWTRTMPR